MRRDIVVLFTAQTAPAAARSGDAASTAAAGPAAGRADGGTAGQDALQFLSFSRWPRRASTEPFGVGRRHGFGSVTTGAARAAAVNCVAEDACPRARTLGRRRMHMLQPRSTSECSGGEVLHCRSSRDMHCHDAHIPHTETASRWRREHVRMLCGRVVSAAPFNPARCSGWAGCAHPFAIVRFRALSAELARDAKRGVIPGHQAAQGSIQHAGWCTVASTFTMVHHFYLAARVISLRRTTCARDSSCMHAHPQIRLDRSVRYA